MPGHLWLSEHVFPGNCCCASCPGTERMIIHLRWFGSRCVLSHSSVTRSWSLRRSRTFLTAEIAIPEALIDGHAPRLCCWRQLFIKMLHHPLKETKVHQSPTSHTHTYFFHIPHVRLSVIGWSSEWLELNFFPSGGLTECSQDRLLFFFLLFHLPSSHFCPASAG